jgi:Spy/CpxP family protein refolding chaperone
MQRKWIPLAAAVVLAATAAVAQPGPGYGPGGGYGPGMMGGYGGPGMMGGYGYGGGPGMMGGWGGGYGPGMMGGGRGGYGVSDLTADQRKRIDEARQDFWKKQWPLMQQMHTTMWNADQEPGAPFDEQAARKAYDGTAGLQKQMFENMIDMRKRTDAVLTPKQREELRREWSR